MATLSSLKLPNDSVRLMTALLAEHGRDAGPALARLGLSRELANEPGGQVSGLQELGVQRAFFELTREEPLLWLELGARYRLLSHAPEFYYLMMVTSASMQEAVETGLRFGELYYTLGHGHGLYCGDQLVGIRIDFSEAPQDLKRFTVLRDLATNCVIFSELYGAPFPFERVELPLSPDDDDLVQRLLPGVPIVYGADACVWRWSVRLDRQPVAQSDPVLHDFYTRKCEAVIGQARRGGEGGDVLGKLATLLADSKGQLSLSQAAERAGLSVRTLQRRLDARGVSFRDLASSARHRAACQLLAETRAPIARIALDVGYENISSFNHAFRRQAGMSPRSYRRDAGGERPKALEGQAAR